MRSACQRRRGLSRKAFAFEAGSEDHGEGRLPIGLEERLFIGTGIGLRYIMQIGPLRLDVGISLDRRSGVDGIIQIHVSIGLAF
jgi:outer membrane protein assembly factor BamA